MKIDSVSELEDGKLRVYGITPWKDNVSFKIGDILHSGNHDWKITNVIRIFQGCFATPENRKHILDLEPINHHESLFVELVPKRDPR